MNSTGKNKHGRQGFTLAELIMAIALLAVFSTIIVQVFAQAQTMTKKTETLDLAVNCASDLADQWKSADAAGLPEISDLRQNRENGRSAVIFLNRFFEPCLPYDAVWQADLVIHADEVTDFWLLTIDIRPPSPEGADAVFSLQAGHYLPSAGGAP